MVLSNKKQKQKLRAVLVAQSLLGLGIGTPSQNDPKNLKPQRHSAAANGDNQQPIKQISTTLPQISKRQKKRQKSQTSSGTQQYPPPPPPPPPPPVEPNSKDQNHDNSNSGGEEDKKEKKKKKRKREESVEEVDKKPKSTKKKKKQKKKLWKKKKNKKETVVVVEEESKVDAEESVEQIDNSKKVYVGGIPYYSSEDDIRSFFEGCGTIMEIDCMTFPESGRFRGIAMITFKTEAAAQRALALDGADMGGRFLKIQPYRLNQTEKPSDFAPEKLVGYNRVYVGNLAWDVTEDDLRALFSDCKVKFMRLGMNKETGEFGGYAHVNFADEVSLAMALTLDQQMVRERPVKIRCAVPPKKDVLKKKPDFSASPGQGAVKEEVEEEVPPPNQGGAGSLASKGGKKRRTCYTCGVPGHLSSDCPMKQPKTENNVNENGS